MKAADEKKARDEAALIKKQWPGAKATPKGALAIVTRTGKGQPGASGDTIRVKYTGQLLDGRPIASSADEGRPVPKTVAEAFDYVIGKTRITPALDEALASMTPGERRTVIAQGPRGYGRSGYYSKEKPGERRFVIDPDTTIVYEVEVVIR